MLSVIVTILTIVLVVFVAALWVRFGFDWARALRPRWRPRGLLLVVAELSYTVTDRPIRAIRRVVPPLRFGPLVLDLAWTIVLLLCIIAFSVLSRVRGLG